MRATPYREARIRATTEQGLGRPSEIELVR
jgi:hypothetical protein